MTYFKRIEVLRNILRIGLLNTMSKRLNWITCKMNLSGKGTVYKFTKRNMSTIRQNQRVWVKSNSSLRPWLLTWQPRLSKTSINSILSVRDSSKSNSQWIWLLPLVLLVVKFPSRWTDYRVQVWRDLSYSRWCLVAWDQVMVITCPIVQISLRTSYRVNLMSLSLSTVLNK